MTTLNACGFSLGQLTLLTLPLVIALSVIIAILNLWLNPELLSYRNKLLAQTGTAIELQTVQPGSFQQTNGGQRIIYVESISGDHKAVKNLFMAQINKQQPASAITPWTILSANSGYQMISPKTKAAFFVAVNGRRYRSEYREKKNIILPNLLIYGVRIDSHVGTVNNPARVFIKSCFMARRYTKQTKLFSLSYNGDYPPLLLPCSLAFLAIPLSRVNPRQGKYLHLLPAITVYILYLNLLLFGRNWIENGDISYSWGLWWIHGLLIIIILLAWCYALGWNRVKYQLINLIKFRR